MQFPKLISAVLAITTGFSFLTYAATKNSLIAESIEISEV
jgi:hypothetical protein